MSYISVTGASHHASSPSVSLERGNYRMRAPNSRPPLLLQVPGQSVRRPTLHRVNENLALLLLLLVIACMSCFGSAYYLFTTRWDFRAVFRPYPTANFASQAAASDLPIPYPDQPEKYLTYLPHSGFHNQRIAFENALLLSRLLHRTLLVPPIRLGNNPISYFDYDTLSQYHELSGKTGLHHCPQVPFYISRPPECLQYFESSHVPWSWLFNLSAVAPHQRLFHLPNMSQTWIQSKFNFKSSDIYTLRDDTPYRFRFLDTLDDSSPPGARYLEDIYIDDLATIDKRLLQFGTLFGTSRLRLKNPDNIILRQVIRRNMIFTNQALTRTGDRIAHSLNNYLGLHLRSGDGQFKQKIQDTLNSTWWKVLHEVLGLSTPEICELEKKAVVEPSFACMQDSPPSTVENTISFIPPSRFGGKCRSPRHVEPRYQPLNIPVYVATDLKKAEVHPLLSLFRKTFPCIFFLGDFSKELEPLEYLRSPYDEVNVFPFVHPFVDALVVGKALKFVGTEGSTFSKFVENVLWPSFRGPLL